MEGTIFRTVCEHLRQTVKYGERFLDEAVERQSDLEAAGVSVRGLAVEPQRQPLGVRETALRMACMHSLRAIVGLKLAG